MASYRLRATIATLMAAIACPAFAQVLPNDTDLKAAFCVGVLKTNSPIDPTKATTPEIARHETETNAKLSATLHRLQSYLMPRMQFIDQTSILFAIAEGGRASDQATAQWIKCQSDPTSLSALSDRNAEAMTEAMNKCMGAIQDRIKPCYDPSFLPF